MTVKAGIERFAAMGTRVELHRFEGGSDDALAAARRAIEAVDDALTIHRPSPATAMNEALLAGQPVGLDDELLFLAVAAAAKGHAVTGGLFDVAADARTGASWSMVAFDATARRIGATQPLALDFGGLGKGLALDRAVAILRAARVRSALLTLGESSIAVIGEHPLGGGWPFAIPHPEWPDTELITVELRDRAMSISSTVGPGTRAPERAAAVHPYKCAGVTAPLCAVAIEADGTLAEIISTALIVSDDREAVSLLRAGSRFRFDLAPTKSDRPARMFA